MSLNKIYEILKESWSKETCVQSCQSKWSSDNPSLGECAITALIVNDLIGGKIMRCMCNGESHYYNTIDDEVVDLTVEQFEGITPDYKNGEERTREYLLSNEDTKKRYKQLLKTFYNNFCDRTFDKVDGDERIIVEKKLNKCIKV